MGYCGDDAGGGVKGSFLLLHTLVLTWQCKQRTVLYQYHAKYMEGPRQLQSVQALCITAAVAAAAKARTAENGDTTTWFETLEATSAPDAARGPRNVEGILFGSGVSKYRPAFNCRVVVLLKIKLVKKIKQIELIPFGAQSKCTE